MRPFLPPQHHPLSLYYYLRSYILFLILSLPPPLYVNSQHSTQWSFCNWSDDATKALWRLTIWLWIKVEILVYKAGNNVTLHFLQDPPFYPPPSSPFQPLGLPVAPQTQGACFCLKAFTFANPLPGDFFSKYLHVYSHQLQLIAQMSHFWWEHHWQLTYKPSPPTYFTYVFVSHLPLSIRIKMQEGRSLYLYPAISPEPEQGLIHIINICWMNEMNEII